jgi:hypothetical protein
MRWVLVAALCALAGFVAVPGCDDGDGDADADTDGDADGDGNADGDADSDADGDACPEPPDGSGAMCVESQECELGEVCVGGACAGMAPCAEDCNCPDGRTCDRETGRCRHEAGLCGPCDERCATCVEDDGGRYCSVECNDGAGPFCPAGYRCIEGTCSPEWAGTCLGCGSNDDCPPGEICNLNSRRCQRDLDGPQIDIAFDLLEFYWVDADPSLSGPTANVMLTMGVGATGGQNPSPLDVAVGDCARIESTLDYYAPFPLGDALDLGDAIVLTNAEATWELEARNDDPDPTRNPSYGFPTGFAVEDWLAGVEHTWSTTGGGDVDAFSVTHLFPEPTTTEPELLTELPVDATLGEDLTLTWTPAGADAGHTVLASVSYNVIDGVVVEALIQVVCREDEGAGSITIPGEMLADVPAGETLNLLLQRAVVSELDVGDYRARISASLIRLGAVTFAP